MSRMLKAFALALALFGVTDTALAQKNKVQNDGILRYELNPKYELQDFEGWGVSLCWWANMCGRWSDEKIDEIVEWLVSPEGLNYRIFRYNIGGGEDPANKACEPHHMGKGKGLRAEMEGFKDSSSDIYHWDRDAAQRKIMLKIKEKRPDAIFEAFSNSCPYYMTYSGCVGGAKEGGKDNLKPEYYEEFAHYLVDVCKHYKEVYGIEFKTLEPFNESLTSYWYQGGSQEGCHFDKASQVAFLKVLSPILKASGLKTVISASDETSVKQSIEAFEYYKAQGVLPLVGQWNTHTYIADDQSRQKLAKLVEESGIHFWMSEVGSGGKGIAGNLKLARTLVSDMRLLKPAAWIDWQYMEEKSDQWCSIQGSFSEQTYHRVKNFSVRRQYSAFIKEGYQMLYTPCDHTLAAKSPDGATLVIVMLNDSELEVEHRVDIKNDRSIKPAKVRMWRTTETEDVVEDRDFSCHKNRLETIMPPLSVVTFVIPL